MQLVLDPAYEPHVTLDDIAEFTDAILKDRRVRAVKAPSIVARASGRLVRVLAPFHPRFPGNHEGRAGNDYLAILMGPDFRRCLPYFFFPGRKSVYLMDVWPSTHESIKEAVRTYSIRHLFISSDSAVDGFQKDLPGCRVAWLPEAIDVGRYTYRRPVEKDIDVLQLGRKFNKLHELILPVLAQNGKKYLFEREAGKVVFPTREGFIDGLARTRISICVPATITHPEKAGNIEIISIRYFQSMAAKCLVLGRAPRELVGLFGYNPVIDVDMADPGKQILSLLDNLDSYIPLIERNFETVRHHHTWEERWGRMARVLFPQ